MGFRVEFSFVWRKESNMHGNQDFIWVLWGLTEIVHHTGIPLNPMVSSLSNLKTLNPRP